MQAKFLSAPDTPAAYLDTARAAIDAQPVIAYGLAVAFLAVIAFRLSRYL